MSVRMAIVKLAALGAAGALIGGGAVHIAEQQHAGELEYVKHANPSKKLQVIKMPRHHLHARRTSARTTAITCAPPLVPTPDGTLCMAPPAEPARYTANVTPVPAPPMLLLFGAAASSLVTRRRLAKQRA